MKTFIILIFLFSVLYSQEQNKVNSKVVSATVFANQAMVTRWTEVKVLAGKSEIVISNLPSNLNDGSVRISGEGDVEVKILDVKVETKFTPDIQEKKIKDLMDQINLLNQQIQEISDKNEAIKVQKEFIQSLKAESAKDINEGITNKKPNVKDWQSILDFFQQNLNKLNRATRKNDDEKIKLNDVIKALKSEINVMRSSQSKEYKEIFVTIESSKNGKINLNFSYLIPNASWYPIYDARINSESKEVELSYFGMVQQNTGEDWKNIDISLSTADPISVDALPVLEPWFIREQELRPGDIYIRGGREDEVGYYLDGGSIIPSGYGRVTGAVVDKSTGEPLPGVNVTIEGTTLGASTDINGKFIIHNVPAGQHRIRTSYVGYQDMVTIADVPNKKQRNLRISLNQTTLELDEVIVLNAGVPSKMKDMSFSVAEAENKIGATLFNLPRKSDVPGDNIAHKVAIAEKKLKTSIEYTSIPKLVAKTFLKGKIVNSSNVILLPGDVNLFLDDEFINTDYISLTVPNDTIEIALGYDKSIKIERKLINKFVESGGIFSGKKTVTFDYEIVVQNKKKMDIKISIFDQIPISQNEDIEVEILTENIKKDQVDNQKRIEWKISLKSGETKRIAFKFRIKYPSNIRIDGLD